jgi:RNA polymerase sigma-70 factor (ECF subfamily)
LLSKKNITFDPDDIGSLVQACIDSHPLAQKALLKKFYGFSKSICLRYSSNAEDAEEIMYDGFLKVFQHIQRYEQIQPFQAWLRTIMVNTAISHYRKNKKHQQDIGLELVYDLPTFNDNVVDRMSAEEIIKLVQKLPNTLRTVFVMHAIDGYDYREIADAMEITETTVRSHYMRARIKMQELIRKNYPDMMPKQKEGKNMKFNEN